MHVIGFNNFLFHKLFFIRSHDNLFVSNIYFINKKTREQHGANIVKVLH